MRIAASTYLNSAPLVHSFATGHFGERYTFLGDAAPSHCARMLATGEADIALIPVIEYQRIPDLFVLPDIAVASKQQVRSVLLVARKPLAEIETLTLDTSSRTSQTLVQIILAERFGLRPRLLEHTPDITVSLANLLTDADAALVIGDPAMQVAAQAETLGLTVYDLAEAWRMLTGLPFVFAMWAVRADALEKSQIEPGQLVRDFLAAKEEGLRHLSELAARCTEELHLPIADLLDYLRINVNYELDEENRAGLHRYYELAAAHGFIKQALPLRFLQHAERQANA